MNITKPARTVLLATDDKALPKLLLAILGPAGFSLQTVSIAQSAKLNPNAYTLLVVDGDPLMPISNLKPAVVVIAPSDIVKMYDAGADLVLTRPLVANVFMAKIRAVLRRYGITL